VGCKQTRGGHPQARLPPSKMLPGTLDIKRTRRKAKKKKLSEGGGAKKNRKTGCRGGKKKGASGLKKKKGKSSRLEVNLSGSILSQSW